MSDSVDHAGSSARNSDDDMNMRRQLSRVLWWLLAAVCCALTYRQVVAVNFYTAQDSWFPVTQALSFLQANPDGDVYQALLFDRHIKFQYPPSALLVFSCLHSLGIAGAHAYNVINTGAMLIAGCVFAILTSRIVGPLMWRGIALPVVPLAFMVTLKFFPNHLSLATGQIQMILNLLFFAACLALWSDRRLLAGVLIAVAATIKPQFLVFGALVLWRRDWRFFTGFTAVSVAALLLALLLYGWHNHLTYFQKVLPFLSHHGECNHLNQSVNGFLGRALGEVPCVDADPSADKSSPVVSSWFPPYNATVYYATLVTSVLMLMVPFLVRRKFADRQADLLLFCLAGTLFTMASPIAWVHHYGVILPAYVLLGWMFLQELSDVRRWMWLGMLAASFALTAIELVLPYVPTDPAQNIVQSHVFFGAGLLVVTLCYALARRAAWLSHSP